VSDFHAETARQIGRELADRNNGRHKQVTTDLLKPEPSRHVHLTCANTITPRPVLWLWALRIALGTLALIGGREGIGKSICFYTIAAQITRGLLPGVYFGLPRAVVIVATEDSWEHTIIPRLMAAGADLRHVYRVDVSTSDGVGTSLSLPRDLHGLEQTVKDVNAALIGLDPLLSRLDAALDSHKDAEVRLALEPLVALAERTNTTVVGIIHVNKSTSNDPLTTLMASRAFAAVARAVLFVMQDPNDETMRLLGQAKNNLGQTDLPTLSFRIVGARIAETAEGTVWTGKLEWTGESSRSIREALQDAADAAGDRSATSEAQEWLQDYLTGHDGTADSADIKREGAKAGHSKDALRRAKQRLGVTSTTWGFPRRAFWALPAQCAQPSGETLPTTTTTTTALTEAQPTQSAQSAQCLETPLSDAPTGLSGIKAQP
jgi:hypothetical protein